jgi:DNA-binding IscR family transcriptional regulator
MLSKVPAQIKLDELFTCLEGPVVTVECVEDENYCARAADCVTRQVWAQMQAAMMKVLQSMTLQDLVNRTKERKNLDYHI